MRFILFCVLLTSVFHSSAQIYSLRFYGNGVNDIDRVKVRIDNPDEDNDPGPAVDVGGDDFTIEFWMKASAANNNSDAVSCGANNNWIYGNIIIDRDRYNQGRNYGISVAGGFIVFGTMDGSGNARTICSSSSVLDSQWHHIAVQRRRSDGWMWLYIDGDPEAQADGPDGDISYPDDGIPGDFCGGPCINSDPFIVFGAEKHDAGPDFPSYNGLFDEVRFSNVLRYTDNFPVPSGPFVTDGNTVGLYHLETGSGLVAFDDSGSGSPNGILHNGGSPPGPEWTADTPFSVLSLKEKNHGDPWVSQFIPCSIFPNPVREDLYIRCGSPLSLALLDFRGRAHPLEMLDGIAHLSAFPPGYYHVRIVLADDVVTLPVIRL